MATVLGFGVMRTLPYFVFGSILLLIIGIHLAKRQILRREPSLVPVDRLFRKIGLCLFLIGLLAIAVMLTLHAFHFL